MLSEKESSALRDILRHITLAEQFIEGHSGDTLHDDLKSLFAAIRSLEVISEASRRLSTELKERHPTIAWREMAAAGNFYRHDYEDVTPRRVWKTIHEDLPPLRQAILQELQDDGGGGSDA